jgi:hypothetical protein
LVPGVAIRAETGPATFALVFLVWNRTLDDKDKKTVFTVEQFKEMIAALHAYLNEGTKPFNEFAFPLNWQPKRLAVPEVRGPKGSPLQQPS